MYYIRTKVVKTRKPCTCFGCLRPFPAGSKLRKTVLADDDAIWTITYCPVCEEYWDVFMEVDDLSYEGELKSENPKEWEDIRGQVADLDS